MANQHPHPLTDKMIEQITYETRCTPDPGELVFNSDDMRAAADWQLQQMIKWLEKNLIRQDYIETYTYLYGDSYRRSRSFIREEKLLGDLKKAMRPQQQEDN